MVEVVVRVVVIVVGKCTPMCFRPTGPADEVALLLLLDIVRRCCSVATNRHNKRATTRCSFIQSSSNVNNKQHERAAVTAMMVP